MTTVRAQRFLEAFSAAAHDVDLERLGYRIYHFFDSDFLGRLIFGFRDPLNHGLILANKSQDADGIAGQRLLMGAMVRQGIGAPPFMRALPPHLYEIRRAVARPWSRDASHSLALTTSLLGIEDLLNDLRGALRSESPDEVLGPFLEHGPQIFYGVELLSGSWESRLGRVLELGIGDESPFDEEPEIFGSEAFDLLVQQVGQLDQGVQPTSGVSGVRDAMALATLARSVARGGDEEPPFKVVARFYTETPRIHSAWRSREVRELLTYKVRETGLPHLELGVHGVLRTAEYYLIRALFPELAHREESADGSADGAASGVFKIGQDLAQAARRLRMGGLREAELSNLRIGASTLGEFMAEVTDLSSYGTAWRGLIERIPPDLPGELVRQLTEVFESERERAPDLEMAFQSHVKALSSRTEEVAQFTESYVHLRGVLEPWSGALRPRYGSLSYHVGLPRWGFSAEDVHEGALRQLVDTYEEWRVESRPASDGAISAHRTRFVIEIAQRLRAVASAPLEDRARTGESLALLGFLWLVGDYTSVQERGVHLMDGINLRLSKRSGTRARGREAGTADDGFWRRVGGAVENMTAAAEVAAAVAELRAGSSNSKLAVDDVVTLTRTVVDRLDRGARRFPSSDEACAITQGYIRFHVWLALNPTVAAGGSSSGVRRRHPALAKDAFEICSKALSKCDPANPLYVLLLNHCVYVATVAGLHHEESGRLVRELILRLTVEGQTWSYRLDDTLGYYYYARAARTMDAGARDARAVDSARKDLREAERWLNRVPPAVDDPEVLMHRALVRELEVELDALGAPA